MSVYQPLTRHLKTLAQDSWSARFAELERVLGQPLPRSAREHRPWWANERSGSHTQAKAWLEAGWETREVDIARETVTFVRIAANQPGIAEPLSLLRRIVRKTVTLGGLVAGEEPEHPSLPVEPVMRESAAAAPVPAVATAPEPVVEPEPEAPAQEGLMLRPADPAADPADDRDAASRKMLMTLIQREAALVQSRKGL